MVSGPVNTSWIEKSIGENVKVRTFRSNSLFEWHFDEEDREIEVLEIDGNWEFQIDNQIPIKLIEGTKIEIPAGVWHRINYADNMFDDDIITFKIVMR